MIEIKGLTKIEKILVAVLTCLGVEESLVTEITMLLDTPDDQCKLMDWMTENPGATSQEILSVALKINEEKEQGVWPLPLNGLPFIFYRKKRRLWGAKKTDFS